MSPNKNLSGKKNKNLQLKSLLAATESKIQVGFTTGSPPLKDLCWNNPKSTKAIEEEKQNSQLL